MLIVRDDPRVVEAELRAGELACPGCRAELRPWGHARLRTTRLAIGTERHRPRRARCRACKKTSVLLAERFFAAAPGRSRGHRPRPYGQSGRRRPTGGGGPSCRTRETVRNWFKAVGTRAAEFAGTSCPGRSPWTPVSTRCQATARLLPMPSRPSPWRRGRRASPCPGRCGPGPPK